MSLKQLVATYGMIVNYANEKTILWLALSEFIDNSISSWQGKDNVDSSVDGLKISIIFDDTDSENRKVIITDNANGMDSDELVNAMQPSDTKGKKDTHYNQFGVGMKLAIFWQGEDGTVYSKTKNGQEYYVELKTSNHDRSEAVEVESKVSHDNMIKYSSGTTIIIEKIYKNKWYKSIEEIEEALGWRYRELLSSKKNNYAGMEINIHVMSSDSKKSNGNKVYSVKPTFIDAFTLNDFKEKNFEKQNFDKDRFNREYLQDIEELKIKHSNNIMLNVFCDKLINNEPLIG